MNLGPFTGETNASPSGGGARQNSFRQSSCRASTTAQSFLLFQAGSTRLTAFQAAEGIVVSSGAQTQLQKGLRDHRHQPCFWFCQKRLRPSPQERISAVSCT